MGDENVNVNCEIDSNPRVIALFWVLDSNGTTLAEGEVIDEAWTLVMVNRRIYSSCRNSSKFSFSSSVSSGVIVEVWQINAMRIWPLQA